VLGQVFMNDNVTNPFLAMDQALANNEADITIVDFHSEATSEALAFAHYLDGRVSAILGTHTHVHQTDVGMVGPLNGVIGMRQQEVIAKFVTGLPQRFTPENDFPAQLNMTLLEIESNNVVNITPINEIHPR